MNKICRKCNLEKEIDKFNNNKNYVDNKDVCCRSCQREYMNERYRKKNPRKTYELIFEGNLYICKSINEVCQITRKSRFCIYRILHNKNTYKIEKHKYLKDIKIKVI